MPSDRLEKRKKEAVRGIQSHNQRERVSRSNPDIDYELSGHNYDLHNQGPVDYMAAIKQRIAELNLPKAPRHDAVLMSELLITSDSEFFKNLNAADTKRFFEDSYNFLRHRVGKENVISAIVHMDEKNPHMHFTHVPVTPEGRLNANKIYPVQLICRVLRVSSSGYYAWLIRREKPKKDDDLLAEAQVLSAHRRTRETYGAVRLHRELAAEGCGLSLWRVKPTK